ncbi:unnamed protein product [Rhizophagus irregularis]|nr:unnamed protein product [Rhizophagus irregularis]
MDNSPFLVRCKGCEKNIKFNVNECLIYLENYDSSVIKKREEESLTKPYETLRNIIDKNNCVKTYNKKEEKDKLYNERIELIDNFIKSEADFIKILKNSIIERELHDNKRKQVHIIMDNVKMKSNGKKRGGRSFEYIVLWLIEEELYRNLKFFKVSLSYLNYTVYES